MREQASSLFTYLSGAAVVLSLFGLWGCCPAHETQPTAILRTTDQGVELDILRQAIAAFAKGNYDEASHLFETVTAKAGNSVVRRRALYGLACTRLTQARNEKEFHEAMGTWNRWKNSRDKTMGFEDPLMLSPFLDQAASPRNFRSSAEETGEATAEACEALLEKRHKEMQQLKSRIESQEKDITSLNKQIEKLKDQINSLEKIHLEIQEKKKEVSS